MLKAHNQNNGGTVMLRSSDLMDTPQITFHSFKEGTDIVRPGPRRPYINLEFRLVREINATQLGTLTAAEM